MSEQNTMENNTLPNGETVNMKQDYQTIGNNDAVEIGGLINSGHNSMKTRLLERGEQFHNASDAVKGYLEGFGKVMGKTKKSEAKAVFEAYAKDKNAVIAIKELGYNDFIAKCRDIRGSRLSPKSKTASKVTDKQYESITEKIKVMDAGQAKALVDAAMEQLRQTAQPFEKAFLLVIEDACMNLSTSKDEFYIKMAEDISGIVSTHLDIIDARDKAAFEQEKADLAEDAKTPKGAVIEGEFKEVKDDIQPPAIYTGGQVDDQQQAAA